MTPRTARIATSLLLLIALAVFAAPSGAGAKKKGKKHHKSAKLSVTVVRKTLSAPASVPTTVDAVCPARTMLAGGGYVTTGVRTFANDFQPLASSARTWRVVTHHLVAPDSGTATSYAVCVKGLAVHRVSTSATLPGSNGVQHSLATSCGSGSAIGGGSHSTYPLGSYSLTGPTRRANVFDDPTAGVHTVSSTAICASKGKFTRPGAQVSIPDPNDSKSVTATCPRGTTRVGGGAELSGQPDQINLDGTFPTTRGWSAKATTYATSAAATLKVQAICMKTAKKHHGKKHKAKKKK